MATLPLYGAGAKARQGWKPRFVCMEERTLRATVLCRANSRYQEPNLGLRTQLRLCQPTSSMRSRSWDKLSTRSHASSHDCSEPSSHLSAAFVTASLISESSRRLRICCSGDESGGVALELAVSLTLPGPSERSSRPAWRREPVGGSIWPVSLGVTPWRRSWPSSKPRPWRLTRCNAKREGDA
jgi:hypothetical protein